MPPESASGVRTCAAITFRRRDDATALGERIRSAGGTARIVAQSTVGEPDYMVYVEPAASRALAHRTWEELVAQGIDAFVIPRGERENGVSVGVFTQRGLAVAQRNRVAAQGFAVAVGTVNRRRTVYLLEARQAPPHLIAGRSAERCAPTAKPLTTQDAYG